MDEKRISDTSAVFADGTTICKTGSVTNPKIGKTVKQTVIVDFSGDTIGHALELAARPIVITKANALRPRVGVTVTSDVEVTVKTAEIGTRAKKDPRDVIVEEFAKLSNEEQRELLRALAASNSAKSLAK